MQPRQSGKTSKAKYEYLKDPENTLYVVGDSKTAQRIKEQIRSKNANIISCHNFDLRGRNQKNIILDEYMFFPNKDKVYKEIMRNQVNIDNVYIFSTSNKTYSRYLFNLVKENKKYFSFDEIVEKYEGVMTKEIKKEIHDLYFNFLTDADCRLIDFAFDYLPDKSDLVHIFGRESFDLEFNNCYVS